MNPKTRDTTQQSPAPGTAAMDLKTRDAIAAVNAAGHGGGAMP